MASTGKRKTFKKTNVALIGCNEEIFPSVRPLLLILITL